MSNLLHAYRHTAPKKFRIVLRIIDSKHKYHWFPLKEVTSNVLHDTEFTQLVDDITPELKEAVKKYNAPLKDLKVFYICDESKEDTFSYWIDSDLAYNGYK